MNWSLDFYNTSIVCNHLNRKALFKLKKIKKNIKKVTLHNEFFRKESTSKKLLNNRLDWINLEFTSLSRPYVKKKKVNYGHISYLIRSKSKLKNSAFLIFLLNFTYPVLKRRGVIKNPINYKGNSLNYRGAVKMSDIPFLPKVVSNKDLQNNIYLEVKSEIPYFLCFLRQYYNIF